MLIYSKKMPDSNTPIKVEISYKTVVFTISFLIGLWFLIQIKDIIIVVFLSVILVAAMLKPVEWLNSHKIPRVVAVILVYIFIILIIGAIAGIIVPPLIEQTVGLSSRLPQIADSVNDFLIFNKIPVVDVSSVIGKQLQGFIGNIVTITSAIFSSVLVLLTLFVLSFYLLLDWNKFVKLIGSAFSPKQEKKVTRIISKVENGLGKWLRGQIVLSIIVGTLVYIGLFVLGIPYALPLAIIAGILEIIPVIGPIISSVPAILVALSVSPVVALATAALFIVVQQLENNLIVPMIMSKVIGLQPPIIIVSLLIGAKLAGIGGAFMAPPVLIILKIIFSEFLTEDEKLNESLEEQ